MSFFAPDIPQNAKQTNCWKFFLHLIVTLFVISIISNIIVAIVDDEKSLFFNACEDLLALVIYIIIMQHIAWVKVDANENGINIEMGPWQWPILKWFFSSQVSKSEVILIDRKIRQCFWDIIPLSYCSPINWCCCHKSYSAYFWPFCCNDNCNCMGCCDGDSDSSLMMKIDLTQSEFDVFPMCCKRCAPCPLSYSFLWCCVYNRIAVAIPNESIFVTLKDYGYPLTVNVNASEQTALVTNDGTITQPAV